MSTARFVRLDARRSVEGAGEFFLSQRLFSTTQFVELLFPFTLSQDSNGQSETTFATVII
jgi:hypothetical protein